MNDSHFAGLKYFPDQRLNIRQIENIDTKSILRGNVRELLGAMNDLAYVDVENDEYIGGTPQAKKLYRLCQYGLQYMMYTVTKLGDNTLLLRDYLQIQADKKKKLEELLTSQQETLQHLQKKKKALQESEKHYLNLIKTLNLETGGLDLKRLGSFDSEGERRDDGIPLNLPKGPHKRSFSRDSKEGAARNAVENTQHHPGTNLDDKGGNRGYPYNQDLSGSQQSPYFMNAQSGYSQPQSGYSQPTGYQPNSNIRESDRHDDYRPSNQGSNVPRNYNPEGPSRGGNEYPQHLSSHQQLYGNNNQQQQQQPQKSEEERKFNHYHQGDQKKPKQEDEDEYEDDFELSESYIPDNSMKGPSRFGKGGQQQQPKENPQASGERRIIDHMEDTISMDFDKEFSKNYLDNLDRLVNKNKPTVEVPVKRFY